MQAVTLDAAIRSNVYMLRIAQGKIRLATWNGWHTGCLWLKPEDITYADELLERGDREDFHYHYEDLEEDDFVGFAPEQVILVEYYEGYSRFVKLGRYLVMIIRDDNGCRYKVWDLRTKSVASLFFKAAKLFANLIGPTKPDAR